MCKCEIHANAKFRRDVTCMWSVVAAGIFPPPFLIIIIIKMDIYWFDC